MATHHRPLHALLGGGAVADVLLWRRRNVSAAAVAGATLVWFLSERAGYSLPSVLSNAVLLVVVILFLWAKSASMLNRSVACSSCSGHWPYLRSAADANRLHDKQLQPAAGGVHTQPRRWTSSWLFNPSGPAAPSSPPSPTSSSRFNREAVLERNREDEWMGSWKER